MRAFCIYKVLCFINAIKKASCAVLNPSLFQLYFSVNQKCVKILTYDVNLCISSLSSFTGPIPTLAALLWYPWTYMLSFAALEVTLFWECTAVSFGIPQLFRGWDSNQWGRGQIAGMLSMVSCWRKAMSACESELRLSLF